MNRKKPRGVGLGVPAEAPRPLDFRKPEQIKQLIAYSSEDGSASLQRIYGLRTHPGVHSVDTQWLQVFVGCTLQWQPIAADASPRLSQACFFCRQACRRPRNAPSWRTSPVSCLSRQHPRTSMLPVARCRDCGVQRHRCSHLMSACTQASTCCMQLPNCKTHLMLAQTAWHIVAMPAEMQGRMHAQGLRLREASGRQPSVGVNAAPHAGSSRDPAAAASSMQRSAPQAACAGQDAQPSAHLRASSTPPAGTPDSSPVSFDTVWSANGAGATATSLLRKLRWLTVGPRYDWTDRCRSFAQTQPSAWTPCILLKASVLLKLHDC